MKPACAPAFLCLAGGGQPLSQTREGLVGLQPGGPTDGPDLETPRASPEGLTGVLEEPEGFTDGEGPDLLAILIKQIAGADRRMHHRDIKTGGEKDEGIFVRCFTDAQLG